MRRNGPVRWARHGNGREVRVRRPFYILGLRHWPDGQTGTPSSKPSSAKSRLQTHTINHPICRWGWPRVTFETFKRLEHREISENIFLQESHPVVFAVCGLNKIPKAKAILAVHVKEVGMYPPGGTWMQGANSCLIAMCPPAPSWWLPPDTYCLPHIDRRFSWLLVFDICQQHHTGVDCEAYHHQINQTSKGPVKTMILGEVKGG